MARLIFDSLVWLSLASYLSEAEKVLLLNSPDPVTLLLPDRSTARIGVRNYHCPFRPCLGIVNLLLVPVIALPLLALLSISAFILVTIVLLYFL